MLLEPGSTCWRREVSGRAALIVDMAAYFDAAMTAMGRAKHTVHLLNWAFEPQTLFHPQPGCTGPDSDRIANFLKRLAKDNPNLDVRILCWQSAAPVAATPAPAAAAGSTLVLKVNQDSWIEIRRPGAAALISRLVKAGNTETFEIKDPALLIVGKPTGVEATLGGTPLALPPVAGGTISRVNIK